MIPITLLMATQILCFCIGSIILIKSGKQDEKTRNPYLLIPALMLIGLSAGLITFLIVGFASALIFFMPEKTNKLIGKADLLLFMTITMVFILNQNLLLSLMLFMALAITIILLLLKKAKKQVPLIQYFAQAYSLMILIVFAAALIALIRWLI